jgi:hypothetical protein
VSPDGRQVAAALSHGIGGPDGGGDLVVMNVDGTGLNRIAGASDWFVEAVWRLDLPQPDLPAASYWPMGMT